MPDQNTARRLKQLRTKSGLTQRALAKKAELHTNSYAKIERGERQPTSETIKKLSKALGVMASDILGY